MIIVDKKLKGVTLKGCKVWQKKFWIHDTLIFDSNILHIHTHISNSSRVIYFKISTTTT